MSTKPPRRFRVFFRTHLTPSLHRRRRRRRSTGIFLRSHGLDIPRERMEWKETNSRGSAPPQPNARARERDETTDDDDDVTTTTAVDRSVESLARLPPGPTTARCRLWTTTTAAPQRDGERDTETETVRYGPYTRVFNGIGSGDFSLGFHVHRGQVRNTCFQVTYFYDILDHVPWTRDSTRDGRSRMKVTLVRENGHYWVTRRKRDGGRRR